jgi:hypothetical protein
MQKTIRAMLFCLLAAAFVNASAQDAKQTSSSEGFYMRNGKMMCIKNGTVQPVTTNQTLANGTTITSNGKISSPAGGKAIISEGELLSPDGRKTGQKVDEFITLKNGKAVIVTNGIETPIEDSYRIAGGITVNSDGTTSSGTTLKQGSKLDMTGKLAASSTNGN